MVDRCGSVGTIGVAVLLALAATGCRGPQEQLRDGGISSKSQETEAALQEAEGLYERVAAERLIIATDPLERTVGSATLINSLLDRERYDDLFLLGDSAFEQEASRRIGAGPRSSAGTEAIGLVSNRVQRGDLGGFDSGSCRSCHFGGGPDGSGSASQVTFFRGNGQDSRTAITRDPPHVMGLGYIQIAARQIERRLQQTAELASQQAAAMNEPVELALNAYGSSYGYIRANADGTLDHAGVKGVSEDLRVRPFGHKGRYRDLVTLSEDSLQIHFGIQPPGRAERFSDRPESHLGEGPTHDRDQDGIEHEVPREHALLLAIYMAMLPVPEMRPPEDPRLQAAWARGQQRFETIGCADCHRPQTRLNDMVIQIDETSGIELDLAAVGIEPRPRQTDVSPDADGVIPGGTPIFAYTDFKRHDLGPALADSRTEVLPESVPGSVPPQEWLTRPLWGVADTAPYMHDGRAATLKEAITLHGGAAESTSAAFSELEAREQAELLVFLNSLTRSPTLLVE